MDEFQATPNLARGYFQQQKAYTQYPVSPLLQETDYALGHQAARPFRQTSFNIPAQPWSNPVNCSGATPTHDTCQKNSINYKPREHSPNDCSPQGSQLPPMIRMPRLPNPPTARTPLPQPPNLEESSRPSAQTPLYVNAKQFERILKRRVARERIEERSVCTPGSRRSYLHESRHKHTIRRPRGPGGKFLKKDEFMRQEKEVQTGTTVSCQIPETRTRPNTNHVKDASADSVAGMPTKDERGERREGARNGSREKESHRAEARKTSNTLSESQVHPKISNRISKAMTTSFYGPAELEELQKRFPTTTAADVSQMKSLT